MLQLFEQYTNQFDKMDEQIQLKYYHTFRVMELCQILSIKEQWSEGDQEIAKVIGLLHDYGRFPQIETAHSFNDSLSFDHADYGIKLLFDEHQIEPYSIPKDSYPIVYDAIKNHNKFAIDPSIKGKNLSFCKLIRDADKLDIIYLNIMFPFDGDINSKVIEAFESEQTCHNEDVKTNKDALISTLCFIYDINFKSSFQYIKDNMLIERWKKQVNNPSLDKYFDKSLAYIEKRLELC